MVVEKMRRLEVVSQSLREDEGSIRQAVSDYNKMRGHLLGKILREEGLLYCTLGMCRKSLSFTREKRPRFIFTEGCEIHSCGYESSCLTYESFARLHHVCQRCALRLLLQHGMRGPYDHEVHSQTAFDAFVAKKRKDGHYALKSGVWEKLPDKACVLPEPPETLVDTFVRNRNFPPRIDFVPGIFGHIGRLVVRQLGDGV